MHHGLNSIHLLLVKNNNSFHFNWAPMIGICIMAFGEFILWKSQNNKNLNEVLTKFLNNSRRRLSDIHLEIIYLVNRNLINLREFKVIILSFRL